MTLEQVINIWMNTYQIPIRAKNTVSAYQYAIAHIPADIMSMEIAKITAPDLQRAINGTAKDAPRQAQILCVALKQIYHKAYLMDLIPSDRLVQLLEKPKHEKRDISVFTPEEAKAYMRAIIGSPAYPLLAMMLCVGLRRNEARGLRGCDLDDDGYLHITQQRIQRRLSILKSNASRRVIPLPKELHGLFRGKDGFICDMSENTLTRHHHNALARAHIEKPVTLHGLRHTCATLAINDGESLVTIQHLLGHAHYGITADIYVHQSLDPMAECTRHILHQITA